jgi:hypothetical protein
MTVCVAYLPLSRLCNQYCVNSVEQDRIESGLEFADDGEKRIKAGFVASSI